MLVLGHLSHYYFFLFGGTLSLFAVANLRRDQTFFRSWILAWGAGFLSLLGWLIWYFSQPEPTLGAGWISQPNLADIIGTLWNLFSGYGGVVSWPTALFGLATTILVAISIIYRGKQRNESLTIWFGVLTPLLGMWLISQLRPLYMDRYFIVLLPYVLLLVCRGSYTLWERTKSSSYSKQLSSSIMFVVAIISVWAGLQVHTAPQYERENWVGLSAYLAVQSNPTDEVWLSDSSVKLPLAFYGLDDYTEIASEMPPRCNLACWWVLRQPYTTTHAFTSQTKAMTAPNEKIALTNKSRPGPRVIRSSASAAI